MKSPRLRAVVCVVLITLLAISVASTALAAPHLTWKTETVYFDVNGKPTVGGYFFNDGTETIDRINWIRHDIWIKNNDGPIFYLGTAVWSDIKVFLRPGEQSKVYLMHWNSYTGQQFKPEAWKTSSLANYHVLVGSEL